MRSGALGQGKRVRGGHREGDDQGRRAMAQGRGRDGKGEGFGKVAIRGEEE